mgnify:CR=1 FL=1
MTHDILEDAEFKEYWTRVRFRSRQPDEVRRHPLHLKDSTYGRARSPGYRHRSLFESAEGTERGSAGYRVNRMMTGSDSLAAEPVGSPSMVRQLPL